MAKKTYTQKLQSSNGLPSVVTLDEKASARLGPGTMLIPSPMQVDEVMRSVPMGKLVTTDGIRRMLAKRAGATVTCPLTTGIFVRIAAFASEERANEGSPQVATPYWRTLRSGGELNEKLPGGIENQRAMLEIEGHTVVQKGKRYFVEGYEQKVISE